MINNIKSTRGFVYSDCSQCAHQKVCGYKLEFSALIEAHNGIHESDVSDISGLIITCNYFLPTPCNARSNDL